MVASPLFRRRRTAAATTVRHENLVAALVMTH
jgi:hypothetical protein